MRLFALLLALLSTQCLAQKDWRTLSDDPENDGFFADRPDAKTLQYYYDDSTDSLWFKLETHGQLKVDNWGINLMVDVDQNPSTGSKWPGQNNQFSFDKIVTVWVTGAPGNYSGTIGISTDQQMMSGNPTALFKNNLTLQVDTSNNTYAIGMKREELDPDDIHFDVIASIGISGEVNDDIPSSGNATISRWPLSVNTKSQPDAPSIQYQPASRLLTITESQASFAYGVYDGNGRLLIEGRTTKSSTPISIPSEFKGLVVARVIGSNVSTSQKFWVY